MAVARKRKTNGFMTIFTTAACEWLLIFLLVVDAVFAYLLKKFALYCQLQIPCPLCSRLDHVFEKNKPGCYWSLLCNKHKGAISSLVSCPTHSKLAYVHGMCEECLMPVPIHNNSQSLKLLVSKLWVDVEQSALQNLTANKLIRLGSVEGKTCSCCNKPQKGNSNAERVVKFNSNGLEASKANCKPPLPSVPSHSRFRCRDDMKRPRGKFTATKRQKLAKSNSVNTLSFVGYSKLNFPFESESKILASEDDDEDGNVRTSCNNSTESEEDFVGFRRNDLVRAHQGSEVKDEENLLDLNEQNGVCSLLTDEKCLKEISSENICSSNSTSKNLSNACDSARHVEDMPQVSTNKVGKDEKNKSRKIEDSSCLLLKRNESSYESLDGISIDDIEGESIVDRLRRQVEHDRSFMKSLYKELEAEKNAACVAVNEAMAMITKLQEEKVALQMEARQYLRMMEEQSEYDKKALETANDLLSGREKELQELEYKLRRAKGNCKPVNNSVLNFEKEKLYISQCLEKLEKKLYKAYSSGNVEDGLNSSKSSLSDGSPLQHSASIEENDSEYENDSEENGCPCNGFEKEIAAFHDRLEALETDRDLLEYASNLLQNGEDGLQLIQDLAYQLQESRKIEFRDR